MKHRLLVAAVLLLFAPVASAERLNILAGGAAWHPFETPSTTNGSAFWNNRSFDGDDGDCNIGYWLNGLGGCSAKAGRFYDDSPRVTPDYLGDSATRFNLTKDAATASVTVTTHVQVSAWYPGNEFGWFLVADPTQLFPLFGRFAPPFGTATFVPSGDYGFYLASRHGVYMSDGSPATSAHFAVFRLGSDHYLMGAEDMWFGSDWDYNDMAIEVQVNDVPVPEPVSLVLVGSGVLGLLAARRRRR